MYPTLPQRNSVLRSGDWAQLAQSSLLRLMVLFTAQIAISAHMSARERTESRPLTWNAVITTVG